MKKIPRLTALVSAAIVSLATLADWTGFAFDGDDAPPVPPTDLRQTSPGSWNYTYWSLNHHGK
jgi:hypothetical protein